MVEVYFVLQRHFQNGITFRRLNGLGGKSFVLKEKRYIKYLHSEQLAVGISPMMTDRIFCAKNNRRGVNGFVSARWRGFFQPSAIKK
jgi:hypothetical protein